MCALADCVRAVVMVDHHRHPEYVDNAFIAGYYLSSNPCWTLQRCLVVGQLVNHHPSDVPYTHTRIVPPMRVPIRAIVLLSDHIIVIE